MVDYLIPTVAIWYPKLDSSIGSNQLDETSSTLSRSIDPIPTVVFWYQLWSSYICYGFICYLPSFQGLLCKKITSWHYEYSILSDFLCIPSFLLTMDLLQLHHNHHISHLHASSILKYSVEANHEFWWVLPSKDCGCFPQLCFIYFPMNLHLVFRIFTIRHFLTRIPLPSRSISSSKNLILQHALAYQSQTSCMDLVKQWRSNKIQEDSALCL